MMKMVDRVPARLIAFLVAALLFLPAASRTAEAGAPLLPIAVNEYWSGGGPAPVYGQYQTYPNSFVRYTNVDGLASRVAGNTFAVLGAYAEDNVHAGVMNMNGFVSLDYRCNNHYGTDSAAVDDPVTPNYDESNPGGRWYVVDTGAACDPCALTPITPPDGQSIESGKPSHIQHLHEGYPFVPPVAAEERYRDCVEIAYPLSRNKDTGLDLYPVDPPEPCPHSSVPFFSGTGHEPSQPYDGVYWYERYPKGERFVALVYDGTFEGPAPPYSVPVVTIVGAVIIEIDGYYSGSPSLIGLLPITGAERDAMAADPSLTPDYSYNKAVLFDTGNTAYGHVVPHGISGAADPFIITRDDGLDDPSDPGTFDSCNWLDKLTELSGAGADRTAPTSSITSPLDSETLSGQSCTISGEADDGPGSGVSLVEVSTDGGATWNAATGTTAWSYGWNLPVHGSFTISSRATDNEGNVETPVASITVDVDNTQSDGRLWTWGGESYGCLGRTGDPEAPGMVPGLHGVVEIAAGSNHSVSLIEDGTVWAWGSNWDGQLGRGGYDHAPHPQPVLVEGLGVVAEVEAGGNRTFAISTSGELLGWGENHYGQLGDGTTANRFSPVRASGIGKVVEVSAGGQFTMALKQDGTVWTWGRNPHGQLGDGTADVQDSMKAHPFPRIVSGLAGVTAVAAGGNHALAVTSDGAVFAWGYNGYGQLGDGTTDNAYSPAPVPGITDVVSVAAGNNFSAALKSDGTVWTWGRAGMIGRIGDNKVPGLLTDIDDVLTLDAGSYFGLAVRRNLTVYTWNAVCSLVPGLAGINGVSGGSGHSIALQRKNTAPSSEITTPLYGAVLQAVPGQYSVTGEAHDNTGAGVDRVDVSTDGGASWEQATDTSGDGSWSSWVFYWTPQAEGPYGLKSRAADRAGNVEAPGPGVSVQAGITPVSNVTLVPMPGMVASGTETTWIAGAEGGTGSYEFCFWLYGPDKLWQNIQPWSTDNACDWVPDCSDIGSDLILVHVRTAGSTGPKEAQASAWFTVKAPAITGMVLTGLSDPAMVGDVNRLWANAGSNGLPPQCGYEFSYWMYGPDKTWDNIRPWSSDNACDWTPGPPNIGANLVLVQSRTAGSTGPKEFQISAWFTVAAPPVSGVTLTPSVTPGTAGSQTTWTAGAYGGTGEYEYRFWHYAPSRTWSADPRGWTSSNTWDWTPADPGDVGSNLILVQVRTAGSTGTKEAQASKWYFVSAP